MHTTHYTLHIALHTAPLTAQYVQDRRSMFHLAGLLQASNSNDLLMVYTEHFTLDTIHNTLLHFTVNT